MKKVFLLSVAGQYNEEEGRAPQYPTGSVYTQQGQLFAVIAQFENTDGIEKLIASMDSNNSIASKAANAAIRKMELTGIYFENEKSVTYARLGAVLRKEGRVVLYKTDEYDCIAKAYVVWKMGVNAWPVMKAEDDGDEWWEKSSRVVQGDE